MDNKYDWPGEMFLKAKNDKILFHEYEEWIAHHIIIRLKNIDFDKIVSDADEKPSGIKDERIRRESIVQKKMSTKKVVGNKNNLNKIGSVTKLKELDLSNSITPNKTFSLSANKFAETKKDTTLTLVNDNSFISSSNKRASVLSIGESRFAKTQDRARQIFGKSLVDKQDSIKSGKGILITSDNEGQNDNPYSLKALPKSTKSIVGNNYTGLTLSAPDVNLVPKQKKQSTDYLGNLMGP